MEASQPSPGTYRKQHMSAITKPGWKLLAMKPMVLLIDALTAFGFTSVLSKQSRLLCLPALPLQLRWWQQEVSSASTLAPRVGSTPLSMLHIVLLIGVAIYFALVQTFLMSTQALVLTNSYTAAKAVG